MNNQDLHYPNLEHCTIVPGTSSTSSDAPPLMVLSSNCVEAMNAPLPDFYDFRVEHRALEKKKEREMEDEDESVLKDIVRRNTRDISSNLSLFQKQAFVKMKSITNASEDVCVSLLSKNGFKLNDSIEAFFRGER